MTFRDMIHAGLTWDPKRYLFFYHDEIGGAYAKAFLERLQAPTYHKDKAIALPLFLRQLRAIKKWGKESPADLSCFSQASLVINGDKDRMVATENSYDLAKRLPNSQLKIYPQAGHGVIFQHPEEVAQLIQQFLDEITEK